MKLDDVQVLVARRDEFKTCEKVLVQALSGNGLSIKYGDHYINNIKLITKLKATILEHAQKDYDEAKTRLMMLGITEFPPVPTAK